ncbi:hypothetical protein DYB28_000238 [Aphanomyces astaci]|uniref:DUF7769 domain-containing protein n=1 Tax=Aphanomyces astaci TaxID=112090 RepID=A0A9X8EB45_APHAT|nr:hypothetical protein DYB28_000238 [Aphanomyces astaci]
MRVSLYQDLLEKSVNGQLSRDIVRSVCTTYGVHHSTGWRIFQRGKATKTSGGIADVTARLKGKTGRPTKFAPEDIEQRIKNVPLHKSQTYRSLAAATGLSVYLLWTFVKRIIPRSKDTQEDELVLDMMNLRLEEEERLEEVAVLLCTFSFVLNPANTNILRGRQLAELFFTRTAPGSNFESFVLELYGKSWKNVVALIGDNCSTNVAFARLAGLPLVVCDSHRFNLVVSDLLSNHDVVIQKVNILMRKLRNILPAARLRRLTPLRAKTLNATRWTSAFSLTR